MDGIWKRRAGSVPFVGRSGEQDCRQQTTVNPCIGATGKNLCRLVAQGLKICAANFVDSETILHIEGYGECIVLDRMNRRFAHRVDIAMRKDEVDRALEFGIQRRLVAIKPGLP